MFQTKEHMSQSKYSEEYTVQESETDNPRSEEHSFGWSEGPRDDGAHTIPNT